MDIKKANPKADLDITAQHSNTFDSNEQSVFKFSTGNTGRVQRSIIRYLLSLDFQKLSPLECLEFAGTDAIRQVAQPYKNPLEHISQLRRLNGDICLSTIPVEKAKLPSAGKAPAYYCIPSGLKHAWRLALKEG